MKRFLLFLLLISVSAHAQVSWQGVSLVGTTASSSGASYWQDNFNRTSIGSDWTTMITNPIRIYSTTNQHAECSVYDGNCLSVANQFTPTANSNYACAAIVANGDYSGACVAMGTEEAICCNTHDRLGNGGSMTWYDNDAWEYYSDKCTGVDLTNGYIGIQRESSTSVRCYYALAASPTTWVACGAAFDASTVISMASQGLGVAITCGNTSCGQGPQINAFEAGNGTLPTDHTCGSL